MTRKPFSVEQVTSLRQQAADGEPVGDIGRKVDVFELTFYRGKQVYGVRLPIGSQALKQ